MRFRSDEPHNARGPERHASGRARSTSLSRQMARPISERRAMAGGSGAIGRRSSGSIALVAGALLVLVAVLGVSGLLGRPASPPRPGVDAAAVPTGASQSASAPPPARSSATTDSASGSPVSRASTPEPSATTRPTPSLSRAPSPSPTASRDPNAAPRSASEFDIGTQAIDMLFPLSADARYWYRDNFMRRRAGAPVAYNHARLSSDGQMVRLHDGIDVYGPAGEPVLAPFSGEVIDPQTRWRPWDRDRYGVTVVVMSDEPLSAGYAAVMVHLDRATVDVGDRVERGEVIGMLGVSGNADGDGIHPHLHFELRAPFALDWSDVGVDRHVDAFNAFPSLLRADPKR